MVWQWQKSLKTCSDEALMQRIAKGDVAAFEVLYDRYNRLIYRFLFRMLWQNRELCEDFTQDIFLKIIEKPDSFDTKRSFKSWIYTLAANKCKNAYRDKKNIQNIDNEIFTHNDSIIFDIDNQQFEEELSKAIDGLEVSAKQCFVLRYLEDLSVKEIAQIVDIPEGTVKSRLHYTVKKLAAELAWCRDILE
jgi:RNA polymerase sigma-70 factor, ECF subfamily